MKKLLTLCFLFSLVCSPIFGQYRINKLNYNAKDYIYQSGDRYDSTLAGVASFLVPGLGQVVAGETGRGLLFFGGFVVSYYIAIGSAINTTKKNIEDRKMGAGLFIGLAGSLMTWIWSITDAVKVAKVNNLAIETKKKWDYTISVLY